MAHTPRNALKLDRLNLLGLAYVLIALAFSARIFYIQIIKAQDYQNRAAAGQTTELTIRPKRGLVYALDGDKRIPLVLNERKWLIFADATFIEDSKEVSSLLAGLNLPLTVDTLDRLDAGVSRYVVLAKLQTEDIRKSIEEADIKGIYFQEQATRSYSEDSLASQTLGFVNRDGLGQYGIEQQYNSVLSGSSGLLRAVTDANGVPLAFERNNVAVEPVDGEDISLTLDIGLQQISEVALQKTVLETNAKSASAVILDAQTGAVKALANYPTFDPNFYNLVDDISLYGNRAISDSFEPGSVMKTLVVAGALDQGVVGTEYTYADPVSVVVDGETISNALNYGAATRPITEILTRSLNTGTVHLLGQLGGGQINDGARETLYDYYTNSFRLGKRTGINLPGEEPGLVFGPNEGFGRNLRYANMTFGQGLTVTPLQIAGAYAAIFNGGTYYKPYVVEAIGEQEQLPEVLATNVLSDKAVEDTRELMRRLAASNLADVQVPGLEISGKTGTAQIADPAGGYLDDQFTGTYAGYIKSKDKTFVIVVRIDQPQGVRFAGSGAAAPIWKNIVTDIINTGKVN